MIRDLQDRLEVTSVVVTHDLELCFAVSDHIVLLKEGRLVIDGPADEFRQSEHPDVKEFLEGEGDGR